MAGREFAPLRRGSTRHAAQPSTRMRTWAIAVAAVVAATVSAAPYSLALWNDADTVDAGVISSGTLDAAIASGQSTPSTATTALLPTLHGMLPGESRGETFTVRNTGNVDLALGAAVAAGTSPYLGFDLAAGACTGALPPGIALSTTALPVGDVIPPGTNASFCLRITLLETTPNDLQNQSVGAYAIELTGVPSR